MRYWYSHFMCSNARGFLRRPLARARRRVGRLRPGRRSGGTMCSGSQRHGTRAAEARAIADNVLRYQRENGGWPKDIDMAAVPAGSAARARRTRRSTTARRRPRSGFWRGSPAPRTATPRSAASITCSPRSTPMAAGRSSSRYGRTTRATSRFNDQAMVNVLTLLDEVAKERRRSSSSTARAGSVPPQRSSVGSRSSCDRRSR